MLSASKSTVFEIEFYDESHYDLSENWLNALKATKGMERKPERQ